VSTRLLYDILSMGTEHSSRFCLPYSSFLVLSIEKLAEARPVIEPHTPVPMSMKEWFVPYEHQKRAIDDKLLPNQGKLILAHKPGTGKTATAIYGVERLKQRNQATNTVVVVPSGLRANFAVDGLEKFLRSPDYQILASSGDGNRANYVDLQDLKPRQYTIVSYEKFARNPDEIMQKTGADTLVLDEFHRVRNPNSSTFTAVMRGRSYAKNFIGLTASPVNNDAGEIATLLTLAEGKAIITPKQFKSLHTQVIGYEKGLGKNPKPVIGLKNKGMLTASLDPRVDVAESADLGEAPPLPRKDTQFVDVEMSPEQWKMYRLAMKELGPLEASIARNDPNITLKTTDTLFARTAQARQISNSVGVGKQITLEEAALATPKVSRILHDVELHLAQKPDNQVVLYSNLINGGVDVLSAGLNAKGIPPSLFVGKGTNVGDNRVTAKSRDYAVQEYQEGKRRVIVLSGAGAEGLSLNNSTAFYALDGHFNPEKIIQAEARARRLGGQSHRPVEERVVDVRRYRSVAPSVRQGGGLLGAEQRARPSYQTVDEWVYNTAGRKYKQNEELYSVLREPTKYVRKYRDRNGNWRYEYPKEQPIAAVKKPKNPKPTPPGLFERLVT